MIKNTKMQKIDENIGGGGGGGGGKYTISPEQQAEYPTLIKLINFLDTLDWASYVKELTMARFKRDRPFLPTIVAEYIDKLIHITIPLVKLRRGKTYAEDINSRYPAKETTNEESLKIKQLENLLKESQTQFISINIDSLIEKIANLNNQISKNPKQETEKYQELLEHSNKLNSCLFKLLNKE